VAAPGNMSHVPTLFAEPDPTQNLKKTFDKLKRERLSTLFYATVFRSLLRMSQKFLLDINDEEVMKKLRFTYTMSVIFSQYRQMMNHSQNI
jgi:hypothetical protein